MIPMFRVLAIGIVRFEEVTAVRDRIERRGARRRREV
jgi:hypothetical protein